MRSIPVLQIGRNYEGRMPSFFLVVYMMLPALQSVCILGTLAGKISRQAQSGLARPIPRIGTPSYRPCLHTEVHKVTVHGRAGRIQEGRLGSRPSISNSYFSSIPDAGYLLSVSHRGYCHKTLHRSCRPHRSPVRSISNCP